ncbi:MAG: TlpA family protein disulfide reductase [Acidobacteria bacterium]|nr:TlpA family protein disulfide reductase [Acidobacteriota bacterium]MBI3281802.1 TlpA family protein disulfide reductase [Acidobacteriota bacterium]
MRFLLVGAMAAAVLAAQGPAARRAPGFSLPDARLQQHDLADYRGKVVLVEFMRTDCPHCATVSKVLEAVKAKYKGELAVLSIVMPPDTQATVTKYAAEHKVTGPMLFDCGQVAASYMRATPENPRVQLPHLYVVDAGGLIRSDYEGEVGLEVVAGAVEKVVKAGR